jgi:hypothetical protein
MTFPATPDLFVVRAGSLDEPDGYQSQLVLCGAGARTWDRVDPNLPRFDGRPPM